MTDVKLVKISDIEKYLFIKKEQGEEFLILPKDTLKQIINTCLIMTQINSQHLLLTWIEIMYMVGQ